MRSIVFILLLPFFSQAQMIFSGKVVEEFTGNAIPYATVGLIKQNVGTNANEQGEFTISCKQADIDSLIISCVGYTTIRLPLKRLGSNPVVTLSVKTKRLRQITIKNKWEHAEVGSYKKHQDYCFTTTAYQSEVAKKFTAPFPNTCLQTVHVRTSKHQGNAMVRVHIYDFDSLTKGPGNELTDTLVQASLKVGINSIDMLPYQIWLPGKDFFVSVEWLLIPINEYKFSSKFEGKEQDLLHYNPCICFTKDAPSSPFEIWGLAYSGNWSPSLITEQLYSLAISATVKY